MNMSKRREASLLAQVSPRAREVYRRLKDDSKWYKEFGKKPIPNAMQELVDARLVQIGGRVNVVTMCFVPVRGFKPHRLEEWSQT